MGICIKKSRREDCARNNSNKENEIGLFSVGMEVKDLDATVKELKAKGANITMGPVPITDGSLAFIEDPNGAKIALIQHNSWIFYKEDS